MYWHEDSDFEASLENEDGDILGMVNFVNEQGRFYGMDCSKQDQSNHVGWKYLGPFETMEDAQIAVEKSVKKL